MKEVKVESNYYVLGDATREEEVVMLLKNDDKYLLIRKEFYPEGIYRLPGGGIDDGETPEEALHREVMEEFNREVSSLEYLGKYTYKLSDSETTIVFTSHCFLVEVPKEVDLKEDEEHAGYKWIGLDEFPKYIKLIKTIPPHEEGLKDWSAWGKFRALAFEFVESALRNR